MCIDVGLLGIDITLVETWPDNQLEIRLQNGWIVSKILWNHEEEERKSDFQSLDIELRQG